MNNTQQSRPPEELVKKTKLNPLIIIITLIIGLILIIPSYYIGGFGTFILILFVSRIVPPAVSFSSVIILNIAFYSFVILFSLYPLVIYLSRRFKFLFFLPIIIFVLIISGTAIFTIPKAIKDYNVRNYETIDNPINLTVSADTLLIENKGELFSEEEKVSSFYPRIDKPSTVWSYQIPDGKLLGINAADSPKGKEQKDLIDQDVKRRIDEQNNFYLSSKSRGEIKDSTGKKKFFRIWNGSIQETEDELGNKPKEILIEGTARIMWNRDNYLYIFSEGDTINNLVMYKLDINTNKVTKLDSITIESEERLFGYLHQGYLYQNEIILDDGIMRKHPVIFNLISEKFTLNFQLTGNYSRFYNYDENYCFWYGEDGVIMVDKNTNQIVNKFIGK